MGQVPSKIKLKVWERDNYTCRYCGKNGLKSFDDWMIIEVDHINPRRRGKNNTEANLVTCCHVCNVLKGSKDCNSVDAAKRLIAKRKHERERDYKAELKR